MGTFEERELGAFETAAALTGEHAAFAVVVVLKLETGPPPERLRRVLDRLQREHPLLASRIVRRGRLRRYEFEATPAIPLLRVPRSDDDRWMEVAEDELNRRLDPAIEPPLRCSYLTSGNGPCEIVLTFHHATMDAASGAALLRRLLKLCDSPDDLEATDPIPSAPLPPAEALFPRKFLGLTSALTRTAFLARQLADEARYRLATRGERRPPIADASRCRILPLTLSREATSQLVRRTRRRRVTLNAALNAAFLWAVSRRLYGGRERPLRYMTFASLRPYLRRPVADESLGSYLSFLRYTARAGGDRGFWELAGNVTRQVDEGLRRGDRFSSLLFSEMMMRRFLKKRAERMAATAVSFSGVVRLGRMGSTPALRGVHAFVSNFALGPEYTAQVKLLGGELLLDVVYLDSDMDREPAEEIAADILDALQTPPPKEP